ncbi:MAG: tRNA(Ile)-lysidine synthetase [Acidobacteria bacterium]|nr:tRNA(Ile)-lysidine synthetase [Acidobacteriota bacterium]
MLLQSVRQFLRRQAIPPGRMAVAVSGGIDSTALLLLFADLRAEGFEVTGTHVNHRLRGAESDADEAFVLELCKRLEIPFSCAEGLVDPAVLRARGLEAAAREVRTTRLLELRRIAGARYTATAHQRNDQAETVLMRLATGGGPAALRGIHPVRADGFIRPLLSVSRPEVETFLRERGVVPRLDSSNADPRFLRNRIRIMLRDCEPAEIEQLASLADRAQERWPALEQLIDEAEERASTDVEPELTRFRSFPDDPSMRQALLHRHIHRLDPEARDVSAADLARLAAEAAALRRVTVTASLELLRSDGALILRRIPVLHPPFELPLDPERPAVVSSAGVTVRLLPADRSTPLSSADGRRQIIQLPPDASPTFTVRNRRPGDRIRLLGMTGHRKLKELLIDRKVPAEERDRLPLVLWESEIVWVAGVALADGVRAREEPGTRYELVVEWGEERPAR